MDERKDDMRNIAAVYAMQTLLSIDGAIDHMDSVASDAFDMAEHMVREMEARDALDD